MAAPFIEEKFTFTNPDGSTIDVIGSGNQYYATFETEDGFTVIKDPSTGYYKYAELSGDKNELLPTAGNVGDVDPQDLGLTRHVRIRKERAKQIAESSPMLQGPIARWKQRRGQKKAARKQGGAPALVAPESMPLSAVTVGNYIGLCILIDFPDVPQTIGVQEVSDFCNQAGYNGYGNNGSVRDYFFDNSVGRLTYTNVVTQYYTAANNRSYYTDPAVSFGTRARELITEALDDLNSQGFDFSQLASDSAGFIHALNVFYAGARVNNWSEGLWPHQWGLATPYDVGGGRSFPIIRLPIWVIA